MKKGPARHTRIPPSSLSEPNIILILYFIYCPTATRILSAQHFPIPRTSRSEPIYYLMNIVAALPSDCRKTQIFIAALFLKVLLSSIPTVFASLQARANARWFLRSAASHGDSDYPRVGFYSRCSALCVMQAGANLTHILELTFKQQIFMIFIVDYFYQN